MALDYSRGLAALALMISTLVAMTYLTTLV